MLRTQITIGLLLVACTPARADTVPAAPRLSLDHVGIQASDLDRSMVFYTQVLGLHEVPAPFPTIAARWLALGGGRMLHIVGNGKTDSPHNRWDHFALACASLDSMIRRLDALQIAWSDMDGHHATQTRPYQIRQIFVHDPDGYVIEINDAKMPQVGAGVR